MPLQLDQPKRTSWSEIVLAMKARLVYWEVLPANRIKIIAQRNANMVPRIQAQQMIFLRPGQFISPRNQRDGEGRVAARIYRYAQVLIVNRVALDPVDSDEIALTNSSRGMFSLEEAVVDALDMHTLEDSSRNALLFEDMRMTSGSEVSKDIRPFWCDQLCQFELGYLFNSTAPLGLNV